MNLIKRLKSNFEIIAFADNDLNKVGNYLNNKLIISPKQMLSYDFDYIIIASQYYHDIYNQLIDIGYSCNKICSYSEFLQDILENDNDFFVGQFNDLIFDYSKKISNYSTLIFGMSCAFYGVDSSKIHKSFNFALPSQDVYYNCKLIDKIIDNNKENLISNIVIELNIYSFLFNLSKAKSQRYKIARYLDYTDDTHNGDTRYFQRLTVFLKLTKKIIDIYYNKSKYNYVIKSNRLALITENDKKEGKKFAEEWVDKKYIDTEIENYNLLDNILFKLTTYNINIVILVMPATSYYRENFPEEVLGNFYDFIYKLKSIYKFKFIDLYDSAQFNDNDFFDSVHLNKYGAEKATEILNDFI